MAILRGLNPHYALQTHPLSPSFIPCRDSTQSYHIKHRGENKGTWNEKAQFSWLKREQQIQQAPLFKDESGHMQQHNSALAHKPKDSNT